MYRRATLHFTQAPIAQKDFALPVSVEKDARGKRIRVTLGQLNADAPVVGLSDRCQALIDGDELLGFMMALP